MPLRSDDTTPGWLSQASFWAPDYVVSSAWLEHGPFAFWLIDALRPRRYVELGTHNGFSYFCVCQAVQYLDLGTACYAVDSWQGDDHAGFYGEDVFTGVQRVNEKKYRGFSTLMRGFFSEALPYFPDGDIDLLHIDGRHGYEDVVEDFESWRPKLSERGIVIFHDINVREREFGVWRLWGELKERYPSFEFDHGHGLGVLALGPDVPEALRPLLFANDEDRPVIRHSYARLGRAISLQFEAEQSRLETGYATHAAEDAGAHARHLENNLTVVREALEATQAEIARLTGVVAETEARRAEATAREAEAQARLAGIAATHEAEIASATAVSDTIAAHLVTLQAALRLRDAQIATLESQAVLVPGLTHARDQLRHELDTILTSAFWRRSEPWRRRLAARPGLRRVLLHSAKLLWWTVTLRLPQRLRQRRALIAATQAASLPAPSPKQRFTEEARADLAAFLASGDRLAFPAVEQPDISVVIVLWNSAHLTLRCLRALQAATGPSLEIILFDNGSTDETGALLDRVEGVRTIRAQENLGFLLGSNRGAALATGRAVLLLNSDAFVRPDALAVALATLDSATDIGAVGGRLLLPSGRLQEAGSIIWSDASALGYARDAEAEAFEAMFRREVDYCSGAFLLTPRALWERLGGLDEAFAPAYYEETDFCLRLQDAGFRVLYEPAAVVDHFEFGSEAKNGDSTAAMQRNQALFRERHEAELRRAHLPPAAENILAARSAASFPKPRLLMIDNEVPLGAGGAGYPRARELLTAAVRQGWAVTLFPLHVQEIDWQAAYAELPREIEIVSHHGKSRFVDFMRSRHGFYDAVLVSRPENMVLIRGYLAEAPDLFAGARVIYDSEALSATRRIAKARHDGMPYSAVEAEALITEELALGRGVDAILCVNAAEAQSFARCGAPVHVLSHAIAPAEAPPAWEARAGFLFVGRLMERDAPNWVGLAWFIREVWPRIRKVLPLATLTVAGRLHPEHGALEAPGVRLLGAVADLRPLYDAARLFVAPVHFAAGVPLKVIEAGAAGLPVIGTRLMGEQLQWQDGVEIAAADTAEDFAARCIALYQDGAQWTAMRDAAQARVRAEYGPEAFAARVREILTPPG